MTYSIPMSGATIVVDPLANASLPHQPPFREDEFGTSVNGGAWIKHDDPDLPPIVQTAYRDIIRATQTTQTLTDMIDNDLNLAMAFETIRVYDRERTKTITTPAMPRVIALPLKPFIHIPSTPLHQATTRLFFTDPASTNGEVRLLSDGIALTIRKDGLSSHPRLLDLLDVFTIMVAIRDRDKNTSEQSTITAALLLDERGIKRRGFRKEGKAYKGCHRREDLEDVSRCVQALRPLHVALEHVKVLDRNARKKGEYKFVTVKSPFFLIDATVFNAGESLPYAWTYSLGAAAKVFDDQKQFSHAARKALKYSAIHERTEKALAYYFAMMHGITQGKAVRRKIGDIIAWCGIPMDRRYPQKVVDRFDNAMCRIVDDKVLGWFTYPRDGTPPLRRWLDHWLSLIVEVAPAADNPITLTAQKRAIAAAQAQANPPKSRAFKLAKGA